MSVICLQFTPAVGLLISGSGVRISARNNYIIYEKPWLTVKIGVFRPKRHKNPIAACFFFFPVEFTLFALVSRNNLFTYFILGPYDKNMGYKREK